MNETHSSNKLLNDLEPYEIVDAFVAFGEVKLDDGTRLAEAWRGYPSGTDRSEIERDFNRAFADYGGLAALGHARIGRIAEELEAKCRRMAPYLEDSAIIRVSSDAAYAATREGIESAKAAEPHLVQELTTEFMRRADKLLDGVIEAFALDGEGRVTSSTVIHSALSDKSVRAMEELAQAASKAPGHELKAYFVPDGPLPEIAVPIPLREAMSLHDDCDMRSAIADAALIAAADWARTSPERRQEYADGLAECRTKKTDRIFNRVKGGMRPPALRFADHTPDSDRRAVSRTPRASDGKSRGRAR